jgi:hypothetical protein
MYDPQVGRFTSADSVVPGGVQGLDRYAYVNNSPVNLIDPSGHNPCDEGSQHYSSYRCAQWKSHNADDSSDYGKWLQCSATDLRCRFYAAALLGVSGWEYDALARLYNVGGSKAQHGVNYILANGVHIKIGHTLGDREATFSESTNTIILTDADHLYSYDKMPNDMGLSLIIHEAKHLEQGTALSHSKLGEMEGWQVQFDVLSHFRELTQDEKDVLKAQTLDKFKTEIYNHYNGYWSNGFWGLYTYPDYPQEPWFLHINLPPLEIK